MIAYTKRSQTSFPRHSKKLGAGTYLATKDLVKLLSGRFFFLRALSVYKLSNNSTIFTDELRKITLERYTKKLMRYGFSTSKILSFSDALASASQNVQENFRVAWIFGPEDLDKNIIFNIFNVHKAIKRYDELILKQISLISSHIQCENIRCEFDMLNQHDKLHPLIDKNEQLQLIDSINDLIFNGEAI